MACVCCAMQGAIDGNHIDWFHHSRTYGLILELVIMKYENMNSRVSYHHEISASKKLFNSCFQPRVCSISMKPEVKLIKLGVSRHGP
jgi:hypothetical protein